MREFDVDSGRVAVESVPNELCQGRERLRPRLPRNEVVLNRNGDVLDYSHTSSLQLCPSAQWADKSNDGNGRRAETELRRAWDVRKWRNADQTN
ncbi:MAG TPA: hypothetical protein VGP28_00680 [Methylocella sp.]|nr:hypothetical protein [Methylocella sp.]